MTWISRRASECQLHLDPEQTEYSPHCRICSDLLATRLAVHLTTEGNGSSDEELPGGSTHNGNTATH
jgi:hypothetical protein